MTTRWNDLVALAREIEQARREGKPIDPRKSRRLARAVLTCKFDDEGRPASGLAVDRYGTP